MSSQDLLLLRAFDKVDWKKTGKLHADEVSAILVSHGMITRDEVIPTMTKLLKQYDTKRDNWIDRSEFEQMIKGLSASRSGSRSIPLSLEALALLRAFDEYDTQKDGRLSPDELVAMLAKQGAIAKGDRISTMIKLLGKYDTNKDAWIDRSEFEQMLQDMHPTTPAPIPPTTRDISEEQILKAFDDADTLRNGKLPTDILTNILVKHGKITRDDIIPTMIIMLKQYDTRRDNLLDRQEFQRYLIDMRGRW